MFVLPGLLALVIFIYLRPFDFFPALRGLPFLYVFFGLAVFGVLIDLRQGKSKVSSRPHAVWVAAFYLWCVVTAVIMGPAQLLRSGFTLTIAVGVFALIAFGLPSFKAFESLAATILACTIVISAVCVHQGLQPLQCVGILPGEQYNSNGHPDGRSCDNPATCQVGAPDPEVRYRCEHVGVASITSIQGRVRYVGVLQDPNEASMAVAIGIPLAFAFYQRRRTSLRFLIAALAFLLASAVVVASKSRGGQLVFLSVLSVYFLRRFRTKGLICAIVAALPVMLMGGRSSEEASGSATQRTEILLIGIEMFRYSPILGVGFGSFTQYHPLTAHNSYVLAPAELGIPGMVLWLSILLASLKTAYRSSVLVTGSDGEVARIWGLALLSAFVGLSVGIFFLSFNYHYVFWIYTGMASALAGTIARHLQTFRPALVPKEVGLVAVFGLGLLVIIFVYCSYKLRHA